MSSSGPSLLSKSAEAISYLMSETDAAKSHPLQHHVALRQPSCYSIASPALVDLRKQNSFATVCANLWTCQLCSNSQFMQGQVYTRHSTSYHHQNPWSKQHCIKYEKQLSYACHKCASHNVTRTCKCKSQVVQQPHKTLQGRCRLQSPRGFCVGRPSPH